MLVRYMAPTYRPDEPVKMVRLPAAAWQEGLSRARSIAERARSERAQKKRSSASTARKAAEPTPEPEKKSPKSDRPRGQVVDVPATRDDSPNPDAKYLGRHNSNVDKETTARLEDRDPNLKRRTNKLQRKAVTPRPNAQKTFGLEANGEGKGGGKTDGEGGKGKGKKQFVLEVPDLKKQRELKLKLSELPGMTQSLREQTGTEALRGNADRFRYQMGDPSGRGSSDDDGDGKSRGRRGGGSGLPSLEALRPTLGTVARLNGSPSTDYVENVPEGEGTFLNTKEFKYATFFIRVKDSVEGYWRDITQREYSRRDPTGAIYGQRNRATLLSIVLDREGRLDSVEVAKSCGLDFLDRAAIASIREAQPFPNPPSGIVESDGSIRFSFQFVVVMRPPSLFGR